MMITKTWRMASVAAAIVLALAACSGGSEKDAAAQKAAAKQMPAPTVSVVTVQPENVLLETYFGSNRNDCSTSNRDCETPLI